MRVSRLPANPSNHGTIVRGFELKKSLPGVLHNLISQYRAYPIVALARPAVLL